MKLVKVFFWNMPYSDLLVAKELWEDTKQKVMIGDYNHFITTKLIKYAMFVLMVLKTKLFLHHKATKFNRNVFG